MGQTGTCKREREAERHSRAYLGEKHCSGAWSVIGLVQFQRPLQHKAHQS